MSAFLCVLVGVGVGVIVVVVVIVIILVVCVCACVCVCVRLRNGEWEGISEGDCGEWNVCLQWGLYDCVDLEEMDRLE